MESTTKNQEVYHMKIKDMSLLPKIKQLANNYGVTVIHTGYLTLVFDVGSSISLYDKTQFFKELPKGVIADRVR
jgi:hypothetical protein